MLHLIKFQSGHSCVIHAKWGNLGFKKPGSAPYDQVSIWTQLCIHAKCGNLGFKKPGSAVQKAWFCSSYTRASTATKIYSANFISTDRMDPGIEFDISIYLYLQILFQKKISACKMSIQDPVPHVIWEMTPGDRGDFAAPSILGSCANLCYR